MKKAIIAYIIIFASVCNAQTLHKESLRVMFYNVENLFDCSDDTLKMDDEFLPNGTRRWHPGRLNKKLKMISKVITSIGEWNPPAIIGLCEVESDSVMIRLTRFSPLKNLNYKYIITNSPDPRGINTALLFQRHQFKLIKHNSYTVDMTHLKRRPTRDILHAEGRLLSGDTLDIFVCHLPSRSSGKAESAPAREYIAEIILSKTDSLHSIRSNPLILIMGDFNDDEKSKTISIITNSNKGNISRLTSSTKQNGTYFYKGQWEAIDHILASNNMLNNTKSTYLLLNKYTTFTAPFLLKRISNSNKMRPYRTYYGWKYEGGYSDHLPIYTDILVEWQ
ncbi:MAG: endonuclease/exonuclease/phosphatase family protein [Bacteroidales bacterium]